MTDEVVNPQVVVVGAGFSGLTTAYFCVKKGLSVTVIEAGPSCGGLLQTLEDRYGRSEAAANAFLDSDLLRAVGADIGVKFLTPKPQAKNRYIFRRGLPRRWPLSFIETLAFAPRLLRLLLFRGSQRPRAGETLEHWGLRALGQAATVALLEPAMRGIYAGDYRRLSASLLLSKLFSPKKRTGKKRKLQSVSPEKGMGEFITQMRSWLETQGVSFRLNEPLRSLEVSKGQELVLACGPASAAEILKESHPSLSESLARIELAPAISVTATFDREAHDVAGFGCLFPENEGFHALGVLFNSDIFENRSEDRSEKWIFGGARSGQEVISWSDEEIATHLLEDRRRLRGHESAAPKSLMIHRWPQGIPQYTTDLEMELNTIKKNPSPKLVGNYLGRIGLSDILTLAEATAESIKDHYDGKSTTSH